MSKMSVYDDSVLVDVIRGGTPSTVQFSNIKDGDKLVDYPGKIVSGDAHFSGDESYDGWLFYDTDGNDYYPEDFGADLIYTPDGDTPQQ